MLIKKACNGWIGNQTIGTFYKSMTFILEAKILNRYIARAQSTHNLLSLTYGDTWIVCTMYNKHGCNNAIHRANRRDLFQEFAIVLQVSILSLAQLTSPGTSIFQEGDKVGNTDYIDSRSP